MKIHPTHIALLVVMPPVTYLTVGPEIASGLFVGLALIWINEYIVRWLP